MNFNWIEFAGENRIFFVCENEADAHTQALQIQLAKWHQKSNNAALQTEQKLN